jgi:hypothetical protein
MASTDPGRIASEVPRARRKPAAPPVNGAGGTPPVDAQIEIGVSGTENMMGIISGEEYLRALVPPTGLKIYEQMRNFAQVNASLGIVKAPILSSTPVIEMPKDSDPADQGIADFCKAALFGQGAMRLSWRLAFQHLLTRLEFGVAVCEKVWRYDAESGTWRIAKLAPRLADTLWEWRQDPKTLELDTVVQQALRQDGTWLPVPIPASKCIIGTYQREGDNYWGRSILRSAYFHWYAIMELLRIGLVRADRHGVGIPKAKFTTGEAWASKALVTQVKRALKALRSHERAYILEHPEVIFSIEGPGAGTTGAGVTLKDDVEFHSTMIIQNVLATFLSGQADGLSATRTRTLADVFSSMLELVASDVAEDLTDQVVRELCDHNFVMTGRPYPKVGFVNIADTDLDALVGQVTRLVAVGGLHMTPEDEGHFREIYKLPTITPEDLERRRREARAEFDDPDDEPSEPAAQDPDRERERDLDDEALRLRDDGRLLAREPTTLEVFLLRQPEQLARTLNYSAAQLESRLAAIRRVQLEALVTKITKLDSRRNTTAFTDLRPDNLTIPERGLTARAIRATQQEAFADGRRRVRQELARQGAALDLRLTSTAAECAILLLKKDKRQPKTPTTAGEANSALVTSAKVTAERLNDVWFNRVLETAIRLRRGGLFGQALGTEVLKTLETELAAGLRGTAKAEVNEAFGLGRKVEAEIQADDIEKVVWSCLLDVHSCEPCVARDGLETEYGSDEYVNNPVPWQGCEGNKGGGDACRCMWLFLLKGRTV